MNNKEHLTVENIWDEIKLSNQTFTWHLSHYSTKQITHLPHWNLVRILWMYISMLVCVLSPCWAGHCDAECVIKRGELIRFEELGVNVDALVKAVRSPHFNLLHCVLTGDCTHRGVNTQGATGKQTEKRLLSMYIKKGHVSISQTYKNNWNQLLISPIACNATVRYYHSTLLSLWCLENKWRL